MRPKAIQALPALSLVVAVTLAVSLFAFVRGWISHDMIAKGAWSRGTARQLLLLSAIYWALFIGISITGRRVLPLKLMLAAVAAVGLVAGAVPVLSVVLLMVASMAIGSRLWPLPQAGTNVGDLALRAALGLALLALLLPIAALFPINNSLTYFIALALPALRYGLAPLKALRSLLGQQGSSDLVELALLATLGNFVLVVVVASLLPEVGSDALALHLDLAARIRNFGLWHYDAHQHLFALIPLGGDFLYAAAYMFGGEPAARLANAAIVVLLLAVVYGAVRYAGASRRISLVATLIAASSPLVVLEASSLFIDNPWALLLVAAVVSALRFADDPDSATLRATALFFAAAIATKIFAVGALPALLAVLVVHLRRRPAALPLPNVVAIIAVAVVLASAPYVVALVKSGNPLFPFYNAIFRSPLYPAINLTNEVFPGKFDPALVYGFTFESDKFSEGRPGGFGFAWIMLGLPAAAVALLAGRRFERWLLLTLLMFFVIVAGTVAYLRYLYPAVFLFAILVGVAIHRLTQADARAAWAMLPASIAAITISVPFLAAAFTPFRMADLRALTDPTVRHEHKATWAPMREIVSFLNAFSTDNGPVALFGGPYSAELQRPVYLDSWYMPEFRKLVSNAKDLAEFRQLVQRFNLAFLVVDSTTGPSVRGWAPQLGELVYRVGDAALYKVDMRVRFAKELVNGPRFGVGFPGWVVHGQVGFDPATGAAIVDVNNLLYQPVPVRAGEQYRLAVEARCADKPAQYRLQTIWMGAGGTVGTTISVVPCRPEWTESAQIVTAPPDANVAVVYATGQESQPVQMRSSSLSSR